MSSYIILNFEDKIGNTDQIGSADSTIKGLTNRYENTRYKQNKGIKRLFCGKNTVLEYRCVNEQPIGLINDGPTLAALKSACATAKKIFAVMHGDPRQPDKCFTNTVGSSAGVVDLATSKQMATFMSKLVGAGTAKTRIALVMCYGARCRSYRSADVDHMGAIDPDDLRSSFAYNLFYHLVGSGGYKGQLTAVTGKIQHDSGTGQALVEQEDMIDLNMEVAELDKAKRDSMKQAVGGELLPQNRQDATYKQNFNSWKASDDGQQLTKDANAARAAKNAMSSKLGGDMKYKYGKFLYGTKNGALVIASKYGDPNNPSGVGPGTVLYSGPLLQPS